MEIEARDALLIQLAQRCGGIEAMFDSVFSFLKRKTDFYHIQKEGDRIGVCESTPTPAKVVFTQRNHGECVAASRSRTGANPQVSQRASRRRWSLRRTGSM